MLRERNEGNASRHLHGLGLELRESVRRVVAVGVGELVAVVARVLDLLPDVRGALAVRDEADGGEHADRELGRVELRADAELARGVVVRELVVPVVPALADNKDGHEPVLARRDIVVRLVAVEVRGRIDEPCRVQHAHVAQEAEDHERVVPRLADKVRAHEGREREAYEELAPRVELLLQHSGPVGPQVVIIELIASLDVLGVLTHDQPAQVGEEETATRVVRVRVRVRVLVVHAVIAHPVKDGALVGHRIAQHEEEAHNAVRLVAAVRPQAVRAHGDAQAREVVHHQERRVRLSLAEVQAPDTFERAEVHHRQVVDLEPVGLLGEVREGRHACCCLRVADGWMELEMERKEELTPSR